MAKTNYSFEKRQREIARKKKQDEKRQRKLQGRTTDATEGSPPAPADETAVPGDTTTTSG